MSRFGADFCTTEIMSEDFISRSDIKFLTRFFQQNWPNIKVFHKVYNKVYQTPYQKLYVYLF